MNTNENERKDNQLDYNTQESSVSQDSVQAQSRQGSGESQSTQGSQQQQEINASEAENSRLNGYGQRTGEDLNEANDYDNRHKYNADASPSAMANDRQENSYTDDSDSNSMI